MSSKWFQFWIYIARLNLSPCIIHSRGLLLQTACELTQTAQRIITKRSIKWLVPVITLNQ
jgi:hypothetical protein